MINMNIGADKKKNSVNIEAITLRGSSLNGVAYARKIPKINVNGRIDS